MPKRACGHRIYGPRGRGNCRISQRGRTRFVRRTVVRSCCPRSSSLPTLTKARIARAQIEGGRPCPCFLSPFPFSSSRASSWCSLPFGATSRPVPPTSRPAGRDGSASTSLSEDGGPPRRPQSVVLSPGRVASSRAPRSAASWNARPRPVRAASTGGASTILSLLPDGTMVEAGEVLCELDGSDYQGCVVDSRSSSSRRGRTIPGLADAGRRQARPRGLPQGEQRRSSRTSKGRSRWPSRTLERQSDRLAWTLRMLEKGYASAAPGGLRQSDRTQAPGEPHGMEMSLGNFRRFSAPRS